MRTRRVIGAMSGTSLDGLDLALVEIEGEGLAMRARLIRGRSASLGALEPRLRAAATEAPLRAREFAELGRDFALLHAQECERLAGGERVDLISAHGQTILHAPPLSWQLLQPQPIAAALKCRVICDLRSADLAEGGQGAPLTPLADWILFRNAQPRVIINLGGFANATGLPSANEPAEQALAAIRGADFCACNQWLDLAARRMLGEPFDRDGASAEQGEACPAITGRLVASLTAMTARGRSLGTGDELDRVLNLVAPSATSTPPRSVAQNALASMTRAMGEAIARGVRTLAPDAEDWVLAGGGSRNRALLRAITKSSGRTVVTSDTLGIPIELREAVCWAVLGALAEDGVPISLPQITGRSHSRLHDGITIGPREAPSPS
ncbi:MAG: anhydro-N-acetylmuramic acid kinase [Phycisphaeraceae bacterium]|nr:anhydro-N-acetylmuramic acid kinase [Phycisphaeraceae bacterium]